MAIQLDDRARSAISHRRAHGHDPRILLRVERLHGRAGAIAGHPEVLTVGWVPRRWPSCTLVGRNLGDITVFMDTRVARYTQGHALTISAWHLGPIDHLTVDPNAILAMLEWERAHPEDVRQQAVSPPPGAGGW